MCRSFEKLGFLSTKHKGGGALIIHKILNNNVVITLDDDKREQIVMGKGIAFKKRIGDWVPDESIDQVFYLANQETSLKFQELLGNIPLEMMKLSDDIIVYAKSTLKKSLNDTIYISLTDHLYTALERKNKELQLRIYYYGILNVFS